MTAHVRSVTTGVAAPLAVGDTVKSSGIDKTPVGGRVDVGPVGLDGDEQADRRVHGGPDKAVYAYAADSYDWWSGELGRDLAPGTFGENLVVEGIDVDHAELGAVWRLGSATVRVRGPRVPCDKLAARMGDRDFRRRFAQAGRPGAYLAVDEPGDVGVGDAVEVVSTPGHGVTVADAAAAYHGDPEQVARVVADDVRAHLPDDLAQRLQRAADRQ